MTAQTIGYILSGIAGFFILMGFLFGLKRGYKKSLFRFVWLAVTVVLLLIFSSMITKGLLRLDVSFLNLTVQGEPVTTFYEFMRVFIEENPTIQSYIANPSVLTDLAESIPVLLGNIVVFLLLFWLTKILLWPLWAIFASRIGRKEKMALKRHEITISTSKKRPWLGGLIGVFSGVLITLVTFMPLIGLSETVIEINESNQVAATSVEAHPGLITDLLVENMGEDANNILEYIYCYEESPIGQVFKYTGVNALGNAMFKNVTTVTVNGEAISLTKETKNVARIYKNARKIEDIDFENLTEADIAVLLESAKDIVRDAFSSGVLKTTFDELMPDTIDAILTDPDYDVKIPDTGIVAVNEGIEDILLAVKNLNSTKISEDVVKLIEALEIMNDEHILINIYNYAETEEIQYRDNLIEILQNLPSTFASSIVGKIFDMNSTSSLAPVIIKMGVKTACEVLEVTYVDQSDSTTLSALETMFTNLFDEILDIVANLDFDNAPYVSEENISDIGAILDIIVNNDLMHPTTFANLKAKAKEEADKVIDTKVDELSLASVAKQAITDIFTLIGDETYSFEDDFTIFENVYISVKTYYDEHPTVDIYDYPLEQFGKWLDMVTNADLFNVAYENALDGLFEYACTLDDEFDFSQFDFLIESLKNITSSTTTDEWETQLEMLQPLKDEVMDLMDIEGDVFDTLLDETNTTLTDIGAIFDDLIENGSIIFSESNIKDLLKIAVEELPLPDEINNITFGSGEDTMTVVEKLQANIDDVDSFEIELGYLKDLVTILSSEEQPTYAEIGALLDDLEDSKLFAGFSPKLLETFIDQLTEDITDVDTKNILLAMKDNIPNIVSYETEAAYLEAYFDIDFDLMSEAQIGAALDGLKDSVLLDGVVENLVADYIDDFAEDITDSDLKALILSIKDNIDDVTSYAVELVALKNLMDMDFEPTTYTTTLGATLDSLSESEIVGSIVNDLFAYAFEQTITGYTGSYAVVLNDIYANIANIPTSSATYTAELDYLQHVLDFANLPSATQTDLDTLILYLVGEDATSDSVLVDNATITIAQARYDELHS